MPRQTSNHIAPRLLQALADLVEGALEALAPRPDPIPIRVRERRR